MTTAPHTDEQLRGEHAQTLDYLKRLYRAYLSGAFAAELSSAYPLIEEGRALVARGDARPVFRSSAPALVRLAPLLPHRIRVEDDGDVLAVHPHMHVHDAVHGHTGAAQMLHTLMAECAERGWSVTLDTNVTVPHSPHDTLAVLRTPHAIIGTGFGPDGALADALHTALTR